MISSLVDIMALIDDYSFYLEERGCTFDEKGFPILDRSCFLKEWPDQLVTFQHRKSNLVKNPSRTALCFYCDDVRIYPRLEKVLDDIPEYRRFMGTVATDVTVTSNMDIEWQQEMMLLNQLFMAVLAVNGIKVVSNTRSGSEASLVCFDSIPPGVMCASGTLGCATTSAPFDMGYITKLLRIRPSMVLLYGKPDPILESQLDLLGIPYRRYDDFHKVSKTHQKVVWRHTKQ